MSTESKPDQLRSDDAELVKRARLLLDKQHEQGSLWQRLKKYGWGYVIRLGVFFVMIGILFGMGYTLMPACLLAFVLGQRLRDIQWFRALAKEWPYTEQLLDWAKIEALAREDEPERADLLSQQG